MKCHIGTSLFCLLNCLEVFLSSQPYVGSVGDCFLLVEELLFHCKSLISVKRCKLIINMFQFIFFQNILKKTEIISTYFTSRISRVLGDKAKTSLTSVVSLISLMLIASCREQQVLMVVSKCSAYKGFILRC